MQREAPPPVEPPPAPLRIENTRTIEIERFIPRSQVNLRYYDTPYYIAPRDEVGHEAFAVIREAMAGKDMVGMGRVVLSKRERPIIVEAMGRGLRGTTLHYAHEMRSEEEYFADIPEIALPEEMSRVAEHILETKKADFNTAFLEDRYRSVLVSMLKEKKAQLPERPPITAPSPQNVISLMDALKRSLAAERPSPESPVSKSPRRPPAASKLTRKRPVTGTRRSS